MRGLPRRYEAYAAISEDELQGLILLDLKMKKIPAGKAITVDYLATNPLNRRQTSGLKHVGLALMAVAVLRSRELGANGEIWLEALPSACGFYEFLGMHRQPKVSPEGYAIYVMPAKMTQRLLDEITSRGILEL